MVHPHHHQNAIKYSNSNDDDHDDDGSSSKGQPIYRCLDSKSEKNSKSKQVRHYQQTKNKTNQQQQQLKDKGPTKLKQIIVSKDAVKSTESTKSFDLKEFRKQRDDERQQLRLTMQERRRMLQMNKAPLMPLPEEESDDESDKVLDENDNQLPMVVEQGSVDRHSDDDKIIADDDDVEEEEEEEDSDGDLFEPDHKNLIDLDEEFDVDGLDIVNQSNHQQRLLAQTFVLQVQQHGQQSLAIQQEQESLHEYDILIEQLQSILVTPPTQSGINDDTHQNGAEPCKDDDDCILVEDSDEFEEESTIGVDDRLDMIDEEIDDDDEWGLEQSDAIVDAIVGNSADHPSQLYLHTADVRLLERMQQSLFITNKLDDIDKFSIHQHKRTSNVTNNNNNLQSPESNSSIKVNQGELIDDNRSVSKLRAEEIEEYLCSRVGASKLAEALQMLAETSTFSTKTSHYNNNYTFGVSYDDKDEDLLNRIEGIIGNDCLHYLDDILMLLTLKEYKISTS